METNKCNVRAHTLSTLRALKNFFVRTNKQPSVRTCAYLCLGIRFTHSPSLPVPQGKRKDGQKENTKLLKLTFEFRSRLYDTHSSFGDKN